MYGERGNILSAVGKKSRLTRFGTRGGDLGVLMSAIPRCTAVTLTPVGASGMTAIPK